MQPIFFEPEQFDTSPETFNLDVVLSDDPISRAPSPMPSPLPSPMCGSFNQYLMPEHQQLQQQQQQQQLYPVYKQQQPQYAAPYIRMKKRFRKKYKDIERHYKCDYPGCDRSYGKISHLNTHRVQKEHGQRLTKEHFGYK
eukprot:NODE_45_length_32908_cov_0.790271.p24 type:complete len:140 gc:universal NODE_45_length_32908_cov_0.790271:4065-3646(-)